MLPLPYYLFTEELKFSDASSLCQAFGGELVTPRSPEEQEVCGREGAFWRVFTLPYVYCVCLRLYVLCLCLFHCICRRAYVYVYLYALMYAHAHGFQETVNKSVKEHLLFVFSCVYVQMWMIVYVRERGSLVLFFQCVYWSCV